MLTAEVEALKNILAQKLGLVAAPRKDAKQVEVKRSGIARTILHTTPPNLTGANRMTHLDTTKTQRLFNGDRSLAEIEAGLVVHRDGPLIALHPIGPDNDSGELYAYDWLVEQVRGQVCTKFLPELTPRAGPPPHPRRHPAGGPQRRVRGSVPTSGPRWHARFASLGGPRGN